MSPFSELVRDVIRRRDRWTCTSCGKSSFESEKWLLEATHNDDKHNRTLPEYDEPESGNTKCRSCHLTQHVDMKDWRAVNLIAQRIWDTGLCHYSVYKEHPTLLREHRIELSEILTDMGCQGRVHLDWEHE